MKRFVYLFPGQGKLDSEISKIVELSHEQKEIHAIACEENRVNFSDEISSSNFSKLQRNDYYAALVTMINCAALQWVKAHAEPLAFAGYSIGQYTALHAAGCLGLEDLFRLVRLRSECMNRSLEGVSTGMIGVIGVSESALTETLDRYNREKSEPIVITNYNCPGNYTIAGTRESLDAVIPLLEKLKPKKLAVLDVAGAWHSYFLEEAGPEFREHLDNVSFLPGWESVVDNVTGKSLPGDQRLMKEQLVRHLYSPVQWEAGIHYLVGGGKKDYLEIGHGKALSTYNFFIDRDARTIPVNGPEDVP